MEKKKKNLSFQRLAFKTKTVRQAERKAKRKSWMKRLPGRLCGWPVWRAPADRRALKTSQKHQTRSNLHHRQGSIEERNLKIQISVLICIADPPLPRKRKKKTICMVWFAGRAQCFLLSSARGFCSRWISCSAWSEKLFSNSQSGLLVSRRGGPERPNTWHWPLNIGRENRLIQTIWNKPIHSWKCHR